MTISSREISDFAGIVALLLFCAAATLRASNLLRARPKVPIAKEQQKIAGEASLVVLPVVVTDRQGRFVSGLQEDDFRVFEDGKPQTISLFREEDVPVTVGLVVDGSESVRSKQREVTSAAVSFVEASSRAGEIFVVNFNERATLGLPPNVLFSESVEQLEEAVSRRVPEGETALYDAMLMAIEHLKLGSREKKALVVISDGADNASRANFHRVLAAAEKDAVIIYTVGIFDERQEDANPEILEELGKRTGGRAYLASSAKGLPGISQQIARELREQYTLAYVPSNLEHDGGFRTVRVVAEAPGQGKLIVRTRAGYLAPNDSISTAMYP